MRRCYLGSRRVDVTFFCKFLGLHTVFRDAKVAVMSAMIARLLFLIENI